MPTLTPTTVCPSCRSAMKKNSPCPRCGWVRPTPAQKWKQHQERLKAKALMAGLPANPYKSPEWFRLRTAVLRDARHLCQECKTQKATTVDHTNGWETREQFLDRSQCRALCRHCHDKKSAGDGVRAQANSEALRR